MNATTSKIKLKNLAVALHALVNDIHLANIADLNPLGKAQAVANLLIKTGNVITMLIAVYENHYEG